MIHVKAKELEEIKQWYSERGIEFSTDVLPQFGIMVPEVAACFMYVTTDNKAIIEGMVTNPKAGMKKKDEAVNQLINELTKIAKDIGCKHVFALTNANSILKKGSLFGYKNIGSFSLLYQEF